MIRILVTVDESKREKNGSLRNVTCPYCFADIHFDVISPVYCPKCYEVLEQYSEIEKDIDKRIEYYKEKHTKVGNTLCFG